MKYRVVVLGGLIVATCSIGFISMGDTSIYARIGRAMETFGAVVREVHSGYVDDVDPQELIEAGIDGMLETLDPYTVYMNSGESEDIDMLSTGTYTGFGFTVGHVDSNLTITNVRDGMPAKQAGLRIGDRLLYIDSVYVERIQSKDLRKITRGTPGSVAVIKALREGRSDTIIVHVRRSELDLENISYKELLPSNVGYIRLTRFSRRSAEDVRRALDDFRSKAPLKGVILDLRDNPGGLLDAAVGICKIFVPKGSVIVSTRGREGQDTRTITSDIEPIEPTVPLTVLINDRSASASEIVAGAIQDLDRGVVIGRQSYGKGLVQTVVQLPHDASMKITTSRYFTPSGRCIQKIDYAARRGTVQHHSDTAHFYTKNRRIVHELDGIEPDTTVNDSIFPAIVQQLVDEALVFRYGTILSATLDSLPPSFSVDKAMLEGFIRFIEAQPMGKRSKALSDLVAAKNRIESEKWAASMVKSIEATEKAMEREIPKAIRQHGDLIRELLDIEVRARFSNDQLRQSRSLTMDPYVKAALRIVTSQRYAGMLESESVGEQ
ncbi:MAG: S41 family peptidase [Bacteroidetes bacterium]|nr:S41 family peptidase [Bacteroidota bacterium]